MHALHGISQRRSRIAAEDDAELTRAAVLIGPARAAGATVDAVAAALGISKPALYDLQRRRGGPAHLTLLVLTRLGAAGALTAVQLAGMIELPSADVEGELRDLHDREIVKKAMAYYPGDAASDTATYWRLTQRGERELRALVERLGHPELRRYSAYLELADGERAGLEDAASKRLGTTDYAILTPEVTNITKRIRVPELAFTIWAPDAGTAEVQALELFAELLADAGLPARSTVVMAALIDATGSL